MKFKPKDKDEVPRPNQSLLNTKPSWKTISKSIVLISKYEIHYGNIKAEIIHVTSKGVKVCVSY